MISREVGRLVRIHQTLRLANNESESSTIALAALFAATRLRTWETRISTLLRVDQTIPSRAPHSHPLQAVRPNCLPPQWYQRQAAPPDRSTLPLPKDCPRLCRYAPSPGQNELPALFVRRQKCRPSVCVRPRSSALTESIVDTVAPSVTRPARPSCNVCTSCRVLFALFMNSSSAARAMPVVAGSALSPLSSLVRIFDMFALLSSKASNAAELPDRACCASLASRCVNISNLAGLSYIAHTVAFFPVAHIGGDCGQHKKGCRCHAKIIWSRAGSGLSGRGLEKLNLGNVSLNAMLFLSLWEN